MTTPRTVTLAVAVAVAVGLLASQFLPQWREEPGPRLRRECVSLVDTILAEDHTVPRRDLEEELIKRGVIIPPVPSYRSESIPTPAAPDQSERAYRQHLQALLEKYEAAKKENEAAKKAYDAKWEQVRNLPAYNLAWETVFAEKRSEAIKDCVLNRVRREGVSIR